MKSQKVLETFLKNNSSSSHRLFRIRDFSSLYPEMSYSSLKVLITRSEKNGILHRVCKGIYLSDISSAIPDGLLLYHAAAYLRPGYFNYLSLESVLSEWGIISQIPMNWITLMSSGRSYIVSCGDYGSIEFVHTDKKPQNLYHQLSYDSRLGLWKASVELALGDMRKTGRPMDLIRSVSKL